MIQAEAQYLSRIDALLAELGVPAEVVLRRGLPLHAEALELELVETGEDGREHFLVPRAAAAWRELRAAAGADGIVLSVVSAFRDLERQADIVRRKIAAGHAFDAIFHASAPPGYSEHHTGRAVDVTTPGARPTEEEFEHTEAFRWLTLHAGRFGFSLSYPRGNAHGFMYEPWHWLFRGV